MFLTRTLGQFVKALGRKDLGCIMKKLWTKATAASPAIPDSLLWPKVIYSVQARGNEFSPWITVMFMCGYMTLICTLKPMGEKG